MGLRPRRGDAHWPRRLVGRGEDEHEEARGGEEHEAAAEALHVRLVAQPVAQLHVHAADAEQAERHAHAVAQQQQQLQRALAAERHVPVGAVLEGVVRPADGGDEQQGERARAQVLRDGL